LNIKGVICGADDTGIEEARNGISFNLYPNPASQTLNIACNNLKDNATLQMLNTQGQIVLQSKLLNANTKLNIQHLPSGLYFVKVGSEVRKVVKE